VLVLQHAGITDAKALRGGFHAWQQRGYPAASGEK
jgi:rhodanese-related sulfurtransferase